MNANKFIFLPIFFSISSNIYSADITVEHKAQDILIEYNSDAKQQVDITHKEPDTSDFWFHIHNKHGKQAQQELERLKQLSPLWEPNLIIKQALADLNKPIIKNIRYKNKSNIFDRISKGDKAYWQTMSSPLFNQASTLAFKENISAHNSLMGWVSISRNEFQLAIEHFNKVTDIDIKDGISAAISGLVSNAINNKDQKLLNILIVRYPEQPIIKQIQSQAWDSYKESQYQLALSWFEFTGDYYAQVLTLDKMEKNQEATNLACEHASEDNLLDYCVNSYSIKQLASFELQDYQQSLVYVDKIKQYKALNHDQLKLFAWSHYHLGNSIQSIDSFKQLLENEPDNVNYAVVLISLTGTDEAQLTLLANQYPSIAMELKKHKQKNAWQRKQFDRFYDLDNQHKAQQQWIVETGVDWRLQNSDDALATLNNQDYYLGFSKYLQQYRFGLRVNYQNLDGNDPSVGEDFWQEVLTSPFDQQSTFSETGLNTYLKRQGDNINTLAELEYWKSSDSLNSGIAGKLSAVWFLPKFVIGSTLYRDRVEDSLLSLTGMFGDENNSERWGAVTANGIKGLVSYSYQPNWSVSTELDVAILGGEHVEDNKKIALQLNLVRDLSNLYSEKLDYLRLGPSLSWVSYDKNLNYYTQGNGGYYSPEQYVSAGGKIELLTIEDKRWQIKSRMDLGYYLSDSGDIEQFPYLDSSNDISQVSETGIAANWLIEGQFLVSQHWEIAGLINSSIASSYNETNLGIQIRWNFNGKSSLTSDGLISSSPYDADYAWY